MRHVLTIFSFLSALCLAVINSGCDLGYQPVPQPQPGVDQTENQSKSLFPVNTGQQICNPSISQNDEHFPGHLLWLNLGTISLNVPAWAKASFPTSGVAPHDRLCVTDSSNTLTWYMLTPDFIAGTEMQDPEWSTHPDFIAFLGEEGVDLWDGYIVRVSTKETFKFNKGGLGGTATPHLWVSDAVATQAPERSAQPQLVNTSSTFDPATGMVDSASVASFFGTDSAVVVFSLLTESGASIHYYNYAEASRGLVALPRPAGRSLWRCESPLISPDGKWVVYNCFSPDFKRSEIYLQRLAPDSRALLLRDNAAEPHWWRNPNSGEHLVVYCTEWEAIRDVFEEIDDIASADVGKTYALRVNLASVDEQLPAVLNFTSDPAVLLNLPFRGGLSPSGRYLGTGYQYGYIYRF